MSKFDALLNEAHERGTRCRACHDGSRPAITELLQAVHDRNAFNVSVPKLYEILKKTEEGFGARVSFESFRHHVSQHEPLWLRGKPKK